MLRPVVLGSLLLIISPCFVSCGSSEDIGATAAIEREGSEAADDPSSTETTGGEMSMPEGAAAQAPASDPVASEPGGGASRETGAPGQLIVTPEAATAGTAAPEAGQECARDSFDAQRQSVNLYLLLDASGSMGITIREGFTRWDAVRDAITGFIGAPESAGLELALNYFPNLINETALCESGSECADGSTCFKAICSRRQALTGEAVQCVTDADCPRIEPIPGLSLEDSCLTLGNCVDNPLLLCIGNSDCPIGDCDPDATQGVCAGATSCELGDYSTPAVAKLALPEAATGLTRSLMSTEPDPAGTTPTFVALEGAYEEANRWRAAETDTQSVVVLATDGFPDGCLEDGADPTESVARTFQAIESAEQDGTKTFVIGVVDPSGQAARRAPEILNEMAMLGGTSEAQIVSATSSTTDGFVAALEQIRGDVLPCSYKLPEVTGRVDPSRVNVEVTQGGAVETWPNVAADAECGTEQGWFYTGNAAEPSGIELCPASCALVGDGSTSQLDIVLGCATLGRVR